MFSRLTTLAVASVAVLAAATPVEVRGNTCSTGSLQCCNSVQSSTDPGTAALLGLLGVVLQGVTANIGITCSPIDVIGILNGNDCNANAVCCNNNSFNGVIALGCIPVTL